MTNLDVWWLLCFLWLLQDRKKNIFIFSFVFRSLKSLLFVWKFHVLIIFFWYLLVARTQKYLRAKFGGVEDEMLDDAEEEEEKRAVWSRKNDMYGADVDYEVIF